ncbi:hypothetical protein KSP40_PGU011717 [Platanthera guangdongensis]|uniref:Trichome birefringence-like N-terminal domain-containing protein n=1 Tax=Platanthera guangdongensis TaxID=2320717 RepID=A0ABR2MZ64_9ASPA
MRLAGRKISGGGGNAGNKLSILAVILSVFSLAMFMYGESGNLRSIAGITLFPSFSGEARKELQKEEQHYKQLEPAEEENSAPPAAEAEVRLPETCDIFVGKWVLDNKSRPLYREEACPFLTSQVTCMKNGRLDDTYQKWRWRPDGCSLPEFNARLLLERLRGKRLMFVGDSLNRNQWESMVCMLYSSALHGEKSHAHNGSLIIFQIKEYNATVEFYWAPFLVKSNSDDPTAHSITDRIIMADDIENHGRHWKGADYLIFNTYIWWMNTAKMKVLRGSFDKVSTVFDEVERLKAYEWVLRTWALWIEENVNPDKTSVFFTSMAPLHVRPSDWGNPAGVKCAKETLPILSQTAQPVDVGTDRRMHVAAANITKSIRRPAVGFIDITGLSEYRKDAHVSVHTIRQGKILSPEQKAEPAVYADCIHWCLPGLPDTWNEACLCPNFDRPVTRMTMGPAMLIDCIGLGRAGPIEMRGP